MDSVSADNNPMILEELTGLSYSERATMEPHYRDASLEGKYVPMQPMYANTLPGTTHMVTPLAKSTPITQPS